MSISQSIKNDEFDAESAAGEPERKNAESGAELRQRRRERFAELDFIRGVCVILMVFDHFMCDVWTFFRESAFGKFALDYWTSDFRLFWHWVVVTLFFLLCGISCSLSRSNFKRGLLCFFAACFLTWGTYLLESTALGADGEVFFIFFGVLHCIGVSILLFAAIDFVAEKLEKSTRKVAEKRNSRALARAARCWRALPALVGIILAIIYFTCIFQYVQGEFLVGKPYQGDLGYFPSIIGFNVDYYSADYFPILPYACILLLGSLIGEYVYKQRERSLVPVLKHKAAAPINFIGRHALVIYLLHQVILGAIFALI